MLSTNLHIVERNRHLIENAIENAIKNFKITGTGNVKDDKDNQYDYDFDAMEDCVYSIINDTNFRCLVNVYSPEIFSFAVFNRHEIYEYDENSERVNFEFNILKIIRSEKIKTLL